MKWYWILLIVLAAIAVGVLIAVKTKKSSTSSPATTDPLAGKPAVSVQTNGKDTTITETKADGSRKVAIVAG